MQIEEKNARVPLSQGLGYTRKVQLSKDVDVEGSSPWLDISSWVSLVERSSSGSMVPWCTGLCAVSVNLSCPTLCRAIPFLDKHKYNYDAI